MTAHYEPSQNGLRQNEPVKARTPRGPSWGTESASAVLRGLDERIRAPVAAAYRELGGSFTRWSVHDWMALECAIFTAENELEHRGARSGCSDVEPVLGMRRRRVALEALVGEDRPMHQITAAHAARHKERTE